MAIWRTDVTKPHCRGGCAACHEGVFKHRPFRVGVIMAPDQRVAQVTSQAVQNGNLFHHQLHPMAKPDQLQIGQVILKGYAKAMADGTWGACCLVQDNAGPYTDERILEGDYHATEAEAISAGLHLGMAYVDQRHPT